LPEHASPVRIVLDVRDVVHHGKLHRREHLAVEVVEQRDGREQGNDQPGAA
jgi:hypothetical protein